MFKRWGYFMVERVVEMLFVFVNFLLVKNILVGYLFNWKF